LFRKVSKVEKWGYGSIITHIAGTACGIVALDKQRIISSLCYDAWNSVEPGEELDVPFQPKIWPIDLVEKSAHKVLPVDSNRSSSVVAIISAT